MKARTVFILLALLLLLAGCSQKASAAPDTVTLRYEPNGADAEAASVSVEKTHLRINTARGDLFTREGYTLYAWNTAPDGGGAAVGLGSRVDPAYTVLYAQWAKWSDASLFCMDGGMITAYLGAEETVAVPAALNGEPVYGIAEGAFTGSPSRTVILPQGLKTVALNAFQNAAVETLYLFDDLNSISDYSFAGCENLRTLHINAAADPVYAGSYYATFADKYDRLVSLAGEKKIVLFSGSSARFGYDSAAIDEAFPGYAVVNMGVFAYTNALPQMELIRTRMQAEDILLIAPELDAAKRQFCTTDALDAPFFNLMEENYDMVAELDLREYTRVFSSLAEYLSVKSHMDAKSYALSPSGFDEDGNPVSKPSYNAYGDYILYRPNAVSDEPLYGLAVPYTASFYRKEQYIDPLNAELMRFQQDGIRPLMTYSPRNRLAVSADSTEDAIRELDRYFRENLSIPVISDIFDSLVPGRYLYGTDNHLSTEGVKLRTAQVIRDLGAVLSGEKAPAPEPFRIPYPAALALYALALLLAACGAFGRTEWPSYAAGLIWAAATVAALLYGAPLSVLLICTLPLPLVSALSRKRGESV